VSILDLGGNPGQQVSLRTMFPFAAQYVTVDVQPGESVDVVADAATWRHESRYDLVLCTEVFEHTPDWLAILDTALYHLKPGGLFVATAACDPRAAHSARDGVGGPLQDGEFYQNIDPAELDAAMTARFIDVVTDTLPRGDVRTRGTKPL
jgi:SAM-dependent methyltransferase